MPGDRFHLSDQQLVLSIDGELSARDENRVREHLSACWSCRVRQREFEAAIAYFVRVHERDVEATGPSDGPRSLLRTQLAQLARPPSGRSGWFSNLSFSPSWKTTLSVLIIFGGTLMTAFSLLP